LIELKLFGVAFVQIPWSRGQGIPWRQVVLR
jgi:hypothetical protein